MSSRFQKIISSFCITKNSKTTKKSLKILIKPAKNHQKLKKYKRLKYELELECGTPPQKKSRKSSNLSEFLSFFFVLHSNCLLIFAG
jgi:hypothetical protein